MIVCVISAEWASVFVNFISGVVIALILAYVVPKKLSDCRTLKDFYIDEFRSIKADYNSLCKEICLGSCSASEIKENFKQLNIKLTDVQWSVNKSLSIDLQLEKYIIETQIYVTNSEEINEQYTNGSVDFSSLTKHKILELQDVFNRNMLSAIAAINYGSILKNT